MKLLGVDVNVGDEVALRVRGYREASIGTCTEVPSTPDGTFFFAASDAVLPFALTERDVVGVEVRPYRPRCGLCGHEAHGGGEFGCRSCAPRPCRPS